MHCGHGIKVGWCVLCTGALTAICQWCGVVCVCVWRGGGVGWACVWMRLPELAERLADGSEED